MLGFLLSQLACTSAPVDDTAPVVDPGDFEADLALEEDIPTVAWIRWTTEAPGLSWVEHGPTPGLGFSTVPGGAEATEHEVLLAGMSAASTWYWRAVTEVGGERLASAVRSVETGVPPRDLPRATPIAYDPELAQAGFTITTSLGNPSWAIAFAKDGTPVWWQQAPSETVIAQIRLTDDGTAVLYNLASLNFSTDVGEILKVRLDGEILARTRTVLGHHDFVELPEGGYAYIAADMREHDVDGVPYTVVGDAIVEVPEGAVEDTPRTIVWSTWDHFAVDVDPEVDNDFYPQGLDWTHCNSIKLENDEYLVSVRKENAAVKVDRATGTQLWQVGGVGSDFTQTEGRAFVGQHSPELTDAGFMLFDNGDVDIEAPYSEAVEYSLDEVAGTFTPVWRYDYDQRISSFLLGDVERLANGNTLVSWGSGGTITEVTAEGELAFQVSLAIGSALGFTHHVDALGGVAP